MGLFDFLGKKKASGGQGASDREVQRFERIVGNKLHIEAIHTNTVEGFFSIFKRGMKGVYQHCAHNHLNRYLAEFDFRYNNRIALGVDDQDRADKAIKGMVGRRLTYRAADRLSPPF